MMRFFNINSHSFPQLAMFVELYLMDKFRHLSNLWIIYCVDVF